MIKTFRHRWRAWVNRRLPRSDSRLFIQKTIFILPTGAGVVFGILLLIMLVTGINYQNSLIYLMTFLLGAVFVGAMHQTHNNLSGLKLTLLRAGEDFAGQSVPFHFRATASKRGAVAIRLSCDGEVLPPIHVLPDQSVDVALFVPSTSRGYLRPERVRIETRFPFGLLKAWSWLRPATAAIVFPAPLKAPEAQLMMGEGDDENAAQSAPGQDHADLRPWREGDLSQRVLWKRFARSGQMVVADWQGDQGQPHWLDFNHYPGVDTELRLSYLSSLVQDRSKQQAPFGLRLPGQVIEPDTGATHTQRCLRALAVWGQKPPRDAIRWPHGTRDREVSGIQTAPDVQAGGAA